MILTVANQKGGVAKSTTAAALASGAKASGLSVLAIDLDPQANLTFTMSGDLAAPGAREILQGECKAMEAIQATEQGDLMATGDNLAAYSLDTRQGVQRLRNALKPVKKSYDLVVIDTPPALGVLLSNALVASDKVLIPTTADITALQGLSRLTGYVEAAQAENKGLRYAGVVFTRWSGRTVQDRDLREVIEGGCEKLGVPVLKTAIREAVAAREAQSYRQSIHDYAPKSKPAQDYRTLLEELGITESDGSTRI